MPAASQCDPYRITVTILGTQTDAERLATVIEQHLCPDPDHDGPCPVPWAIDVAYDPDDDEARTELSAGQGDGASAGR